MASSLNVLIVDDEEIVRDTLSAFLTEFGHRVQVVGDGISALEAIEGCAFDLAMIDVRMPGMDGLTLLARSREVCPEMPVIMMTGHGDTEMSDQAGRLGALDFMVKPIRLRDLSDLFDKMVRPC